MNPEYQYGYLLAGYGRPACHRVTIADRVRMRIALKRRAREWRLFV